MNAQEINQPMVVEAIPTSPALAGGMNNISVAGASNAAAMALSNGAAAEALGMIQVAKMFPRNEKECMTRIQNACARTKLAEKATYAYAKGGTSIEGASIALLRAIADAWGNIKSGYRILESTKVSTKCEAFAWNMESNRLVTVPFTVSHVRYTKKGSYPLTDDREIYELIANNGSRRERKCLESVIPADVVEQALEWCEETNRATVGKFDSAKLLAAFEPYGVVKADIEEFIQRGIEALKDAPGLIVRLRKILTSLKDGVAKKEDFFKSEPKAEAKDAAKNIAASSAKPKTMDEALAEEA